MNKPVPRNYQMVIVEAVRDAFRQGKQCPLVVAPTGSGKTVTFAYITDGAAALDNATLIAAHRKEIIRQISLSLALFGVEHQVIAPPDKVRAIKLAHFKAFGRSFVNHTSATMVGSVQTIVGRFDVIDDTLKRLTARLGRRARLLVIMDEAHHVVEHTQWGAVMDRYVNKAEEHYKGLGLLFTASPERLDGRGLGKGFGGYADILIEGPPMAWLMDNGYLARYRIFTTRNPIDMTGVGTRMGDFIVKDAEERADKPGITGDVIEHYKQRANGMRAVAFCVSVKHSKHVADQFNAAGIPAAHIDGGVDDAVRDQAIIDFANGKLLVLCQVNLVSEGFDLGSIAQMDVTIDCLIDLAPTQSLVNYLQRGGRILRPRDGMIKIYLDHAGNVLRHGLLEMLREWSLEGRKKKKRKAKEDDEEDAGADVGVRVCPECFSIFSPSDAVAAGREKAAAAGVDYTTPCCPECKHDMEIKGRTVKEHDGQLVELSPEAIEAMRKAQRWEQGKAQTVEELVKIGKTPAQARKIVEGRREKADLADQAKAALADWHQRHRIPPKNVFGIWTEDIRKMKPKELKQLIKHIADDDAKRGGDMVGQAMEISPVA